MNSKKKKKSTPEQRTQNMRTVALRAGVSSATVSRVINGLPSVKQETAEHVRKIIEELRFIPNPSATTLKYGRSNTYGLIVPDLTNPFFPEFLLHFEQVFVENDHEILVATTQSSEEKLTNSVRRMIMRRVDGVVLMASEMDTRSIEPIFDHQIPMVTVDRRRVHKGCGDVAIAFENGFREAVVYLKELGHRRIGFVGGTEGLTTSEVRLQAFQQALQNAGLMFTSRFVRAADYRVDGADAAMSSLLNEPDRPTAIMTVNDLTAFGVLRALHRAGIKVPSEMSVVGFDGILLSSAVQPPLTTIAISLKDMANRCLEALGKLKADVSKRGPLLLVNSKLLIRESTGPAPPK